VSAPLPRLIPRLVFRNWRLKIAALCLAVLLWALLRPEPINGVDVFTIPVRAQVGDLDWVLEGEPVPATVRVRLRGPTEDLMRIARDGTTLRVPLDSVSSGDTVVQLRRDWVVLGSSGVVVEDIEPATVRLALQPTLATVLPLRVVSGGSLPEDLALAAPVGLNPQGVRVRGPAHQVRALDSIRLPLDLDEVTESGIYPLEVDTTGLGGISVTPLAVTASIRLEPALERTLGAVTVVVEDSSGAIGPSLAFAVAPAAMEVRLSGARTPVTETREEEVRAVVPWSAIRALLPGETRIVPIELRGVPGLVRAFSGADSVLVRRSLP